MSICVSNPIHYARSFGNHSNAYAHYVSVRIFPDQSGSEKKTTRQKYYKTPFLPVSASTIIHNMRLICSSD